MTVEAQVPEDQAGSTGATKGVSGPLTVGTRKRRQADGLQLDPASSQHATSDSL